MTSLNGHRISPAYVHVVRRGYISAQPDSIPTTTPTLPRTTMTHTHEHVPLPRFPSPYAHPPNSLALSLSLAAATPSPRSPATAAPVFLLAAPPRPAVLRLAPPPLPPASPCPPPSSTGPTASPSSRPHLSASPPFPAMLGVPGVPWVPGVTALDLERLAAVAQFLAWRTAMSDDMLVVADAPSVAWDYTTRSNMHVLAQCERDRAPAECDRCLDYAARVAAACCWGLDPWRDGMAAVVIGFNCYPRFDISTVSVPLRQQIGMFVNDHPALTFLLGALVVVLVVGGVVRLVQEMYCCWMERKIRAARNVARSSFEQT